MPKMTKPWRYVAIFMAVLAFAVISARLVIPEKVLVAADSNCIPFYQDFSGECLQWAEAAYNVPGVLIMGALNALLWFGLVYLVFLLVYGIRKAFGRDSRSTASVGATLEAEKQKITPEP